jgi:hypothetical protein
LAAEQSVSLLVAVATTAGALGVVPCVSLCAIRERDDVIQRAFKWVRAFPVGFLDRLHSADSTDPFVAVAHRKATDAAVIGNIESFATFAKIPAFPFGSFLPDPKELDPIQPST